MAVAVAEVSQKFVDALNQKFSDSFIVLPGKKFDRVVLNDEDSQRAHAFIERTNGHLYKAATWKTPAKSPRFHLASDEVIAETASMADRYGSYLYKRSH